MFTFGFTNKRIMPLKESKGNMYTWCTHTWSPLSGECEHGCAYCYVKRWGQQQKPIHLIETFFKDDLGSGNTIFVVSGADLFANNVPDEWIFRVLEHCRKFDNEYLFQSKNSLRFARFIEYFPKSIFCTTIETNRFYESVMGNTISTQSRAYGMSLMDDYKRFLTIEPIMDFDIDEMVALVSITRATQVNIGADSGNNHLPEPGKDKILSLIGELQKFTTIDRKSNLERLLK